MAAIMSYLEDVEELECRHGNQDRATIIGLCERSTLWLTQLAK
jgi:hypothetical protein